MAQTLIFSTLSGKAVYSDSACKSVFLIFCQLGSNTVSITNGGTESLVQLREISIKSACQADHFEITKYVAGNKGIARCY